MSDENDLWAGDLTQEEIVEGMKQASRELREWITQGTFEADIRKRGIEIARQKAEGIYQTKRQAEEFSRIFKDDANPADVARLNARLEALVNLPHRNEAQAKEMRELMRQLQDTFRKGGKK
jgi:hypothetical protein